MPLEDLKPFNWDEMADFNKLFKEKPVRKEMQTEVYQPIIFYNRIIKKGLFRKETVPISFSCNKVFLNKDEASCFVGNYVKFLINDGSLPAEAIIKKDGQEIVNTDIVAVGITTLSILKLSKEL